LARNELGEILKANYREKSGGVNTADLLLLNKNDMIEKFINGKLVDWIWEM